MDLVFEWDEGKASANLQKHGVSFEEAQTVFGDPRSITIFDAEHSTDEDRFIDLGLSAEGRLLAVVYTERGERIRIIGSRQATLTERKQYEQR
jgi:uncharacterized DUF497 family protein